MHSYAAPGWLGGAHAVGRHLQTIWPALVSSRHDGGLPSYRRERWPTPDGDFIDVDWLEPVLPPGARPEERPLLICFHGLEGSSRSHYALALAAAASERGWRYAVPHFRGCSGEPNLAPRAYHSGDHVEIGWMLDGFAQRHAGPRLALGVSLGGNALLRWGQEAGDAASSRLRALAAVCAPLDLTAAGRAIGLGFNRQVYTRMFLRTMRAKALAKWQQHPGLFDLEALRRARDLYEFDDLFTGPLHGFAGVEDYWRRCSSAPQLHRLRLPSLVLNARNDPFVPVSSLPDAVPGDWVELWRPAQGGHVGFPEGPFPGTLKAMPREVLGWLARTL